MFPIKNVAFLTSGGDSPGMNASIRAITRMALYENINPFAVLDGFSGLIEGQFKLFGWNDVSNIMPIGGTILRTARCPEFLTFEGRKRAALNLIKNSIDALIVIGGDGSLSGANVIHEEWGEIVKELVTKGAITKDEASRSANMPVVGLAASIDNDIFGTELSIGADSALHRVIEAINSISSTASSHSRAFVIEVMGRQCGWLALNSFIASGADWVFIPELDIKENWEEEMCAKIAENRLRGKRDNIVLVAEGCASEHFDIYKVRKAIEQTLNLDCRITVLGHVQRGGTPSAIDRYTATIQGCRAIQVIKDGIATKKACFIGMFGNKTVEMDLGGCVKKNEFVKCVSSGKNNDELVRLRGYDFETKLEFACSQMNPNPSIKSDRKRIALLTLGAPSGGMNAAIYSVVNFCLTNGHTPFAVFNGFEGFVDNNMREVDWSDIGGIVGKGGSLIGTNRTLLDDLAPILTCIHENRLDILVIIGGFEAYVGSLRLKAKLLASGIDFSLLYIPATISNNIPTTEYSIGTDTALNIIAEACDSVKQSAISSKKRVFVVEVQGGNCGYLATLGGLISGASQAYIPEFSLKLDQLRADAIKLRTGFASASRQGRLIIRSENCSHVYDTKLIAHIFQDEGMGVFDARWTILGHLQQGGLPSPADRILGFLFAYEGLKSLVHLSPGAYKAAIQKDAKIAIIDLDELSGDADFVNRKGRKNDHWLWLKTLYPILSW